MAASPLQIQTLYAELLERTAADAFEDAFAETGDFVRKSVKGRNYWYFQSATPEGQRQKYVGPETPALLERIARHKQRHGDRRERRTMVSALVRSFGISRPSSELGTIVEALAAAGAFRLRGVLVGTVAFQTYAPILGVPLRGSFLRTGDVDIAQFRNVSVAINDRIPPLLEVLRAVDPSFRAVPHNVDGRRVTSYRAQGDMRVDFLTPNEGPETSAPKSLPALRTDAEPLRFLDFLIHEPEPAVVLHGSGVYVLVPAPHRFAIHKLIVSRRRSAGNPKRDKDVAQASALLGVLAEKRPFELREAWDEANARGAIWRKLIAEAMTLLQERTRQAVLRVVEA
jgi:hypothetical protein